MCLTISFLVLKNSELQIFSVNYGIILIFSNRSKIQVSFLCNLIDFLLVITFFYYKFWSLIMILLKASKHSSTTCKTINAAQICSVAVLTQPKHNALQGQQLPKPLIGSLLFWTKDSVKNKMLCMRLLRILAHTQLWLSNHFLISGRSQ